MKKAFAVCGLQWGDEGKGSVVDWLTREHHASLVVRLGGCQAAHHVVTDDGRAHCFAQFGSGTFAGARTHLSRAMVIEPLALIREAHQLGMLGVRQPLATRLTVDPDAPVVTPYHKAMNRFREAIRGNLRHGSCGMGIGELAADREAGRDVLTFRSLLFGDDAELRLAAIRQRFLDEAEPYVAKLGDEVLQWYYGLMEAAPAWLGRVRLAFLNGGVTGDQFRFEQLRSDIPYDDQPFIIENSQGVLLDEAVGFPPYHTWLNTTFTAVERLLTGVLPMSAVECLGVLRSFATRHGPGPFPTEDPSLVDLVRDDHNRHGPWQGDFRVGYFDVPLARYAIRSSGGCDGIVLTHIDKISSPWRFSASYPLDENLDQYPQPLAQQAALTRALTMAKTIPLISARSVDGFVRKLELLLQVPIAALSAGPTADAKRYRKKA